MEEDIKILEKINITTYGTKEELEALGKELSEVDINKIIKNLIIKYKDQQRVIEEQQKEIIQATHMYKKEIKEQEKIIELAIEELYLFNAYDCDYSDLKEHTCTKNDDDKVEIQKAKCKKCIREIIEKKAKGE